MKIISNGINNFTESATLKKGNLVIGASSTIIRKLLMEFIVTFTKQYPSIKISIVDSNSAKLIRYVKRGEIDLAILNTPIDEEHLFNITPITQTTDCFIASIDFPHNKLSNEQLIAEPLILQKRPSNNRDFFELMCVENNINLKPQYEIGSFGLITDFVEKGLGIAYTIKDFVLSDIKNKRVKEIETNLQIKPRKIVAITTQVSVNSFACKTFIEDLVNYFNTKK